MEKRLEQIDNKWNEGSRKELEDLKAVGEKRIIRNNLYAL